MLYRFRAISVFLRDYVRLLVRLKTHRATDSVLPVRLCGATLIFKSHTSPNISNHYLTVKPPRLPVSVFGAHWKKWPTFNFGLDFCLVVGLVARSRLPFPLSPCVEIQLNLSEYFPDPPRRFQMLRV